MEYSLGLIKRHIFRIKSPIPLPPVGQRFWLFVYAIASGIYRVFVGIMIILVVTNQVPVLGVLMAIGGVITWLVVPVAKVSHYLLLDPELHRKRSRAIAFSVAVAGAILVLIGLINFPMRFEATGIVEPEQKVTLRARTPGFVDQILVKDGQHVRTGQALVTCYDKNLESDIAKKEAELKAVQSMIQQGIVQSQADRIQYEIQRLALKSQLTILYHQRDDLSIKAPFDGQVVAPMIHELSGKYLHQGEEVATVVQSDPLVVRATLDQSVAALLFMDEPVWNPFPFLKNSNSYAATGDDVANRLFEEKMPFAQEPPEARREIGEPVRRITIPRTKLIAGQEGTVVVDFENNRLSKITGTFKERGAFDALLQAHSEKVGKPDASPAASSQPMPTGQRKAHWMAEHDIAALDIDLVEQSGGGAPPVTTLTYRILGQKVDVRLADARSENLEARVLTRIPAASPNVPHPAMTHMGGGDQQNDPRDQSGTKVQVPVFEVRLRLANANLEHLPGQRAYVRFTMEKDRPLLWQWARKFWQLVQTQNASNKWL
jgi:hypothetical protein